MNIEELLNGGEPSMEDYAGFLDACERLPTELLWALVTKHPNLHWLLKAVANEQLKLKIQKENKDRFNESLLKGLTEELR
jgi:hypothetical protein